MGKDRIDQLANLALITKGANLKIGSKSPAEYLPDLEEANPGGIGITVDSGRPAPLDSRCLCPILGGALHAFLRKLLTS